MFKYFTEQNNNTDYDYYNYILYIHIFCNLGTLPNYLWISHIWILLNCIAG